MRPSVLRPLGVLTARRLSTSAAYHTFDVAAASSKAETVTRPRASPNYTSFVASESAVVWAMPDSRSKVQQRDAPRAAVAEEADDDGMCFEPVPFYKRPFHKEQDDDRMCG